MAPIVDGLAKQYQGRVAVRNMDADNDPDVAKLSVDVLPSYVFLDSTGNVIERQDGGNPEALGHGFQKAAGK